MHTDDSIIQPKLSAEDAGICFLPFQPCIDLARPTIDQYVVELNKQEGIELETEKLLEEAEKLLAKGLVRRDIEDKPGEAAVSGKIQQRFSVIFRTVSGF